MSIVLNGTSGITTPDVQTATETASGLVNLTGGQIKFPATQNPSSDVNTLDDYEEGTWTPTDGSGAGLTFTVGWATYTKIGRVVYFQTQITYPTTVSGASSAINGLPFTASSSGSPAATVTNSSTAITAYVSGLTSQLVIYNSTTAAAIANSALSAKNIYVSGFYFV